MLTGSTLQLSRKKSPDLHAWGFAPVSLQPCISSVNVTGLQVLQAGRAQAICQASRAVAEPRHPLPRGQLLATAWLCASSACDVLPTDGCLASSLPGPARFSGKEAVLQPAELLSCVLLRRTSHAPDTSKCITLSPHGRAAILRQEFAALGRFLGEQHPRVLVVWAVAAGSSRMGHLQEEETWQGFKMDIPAGSTLAPGTLCWC